MIKAVAIGLLSFLLFLILHVIVFRVLAPERRFRTLVVIFFSIIPLYALSYHIVPTPFLVLAPVGAVRPWIPIETVYRATAALNFLSGLVLYIFLFLGYCQFYFIVDRSVSVRAMIEIENSRSKRLSTDELSSIYGLEDMFHRRIGQMLKARYIRESSGLYENTIKGRFISRSFGFFKDLLKLGKGG